MLDDHIRALYFWGDACHTRDASVVCVPNEVLDRVATYKGQVFAVLFEDQAPDDRLVQLARGLDPIGALVA